MMLMRLLVVVVLLLLLPGCRTPAAQSGAPDAPEGSPTDTLRLDAPLWSREGLSAQFRTIWLQQQTPPELDYAPGATAWRQAQVEVPAELAAPEAAQAATPGALLVTLIQALGWDAVLGQEVWEQTTRIWQEGEQSAAGVILRWGLKDDAVAGHDLRVHMRHGGGGWYIERVEERFHCSRGVTAEGLCI